MRRSILLAICDFLILSALSLSSGISQYHKPVEHINPTGPSLTASSGEVSPVQTEPSWRSEFAVTNERIQLIKAQKQIDQLAVSEAMLQQKQEQAKRELAQRDANIKSLEDINREIASRHSRLVQKASTDKELIRDIDSIVQDLSTKNKELSSDLTKKSFRIDNLAKLNTNLANENKQLSSTILSKEKQIETLDSRTESLKSGFKDLESVIKNKDQIIQQVKLTTEQIKKDNVALAGSLEKQRERLAKEISERELLADQRNKLKEQMNDVMIRVQEEHQQKKRELAQKDNTLSDTLAELKRKEDELTKLQIKLAKLSQGNGYVWEKYSSSSIKLDVSITEESSLSPKTQTRTGFYPEINIATKSYIVSEFESLGFSWSRITRNQVSKLQIVVGDKSNITAPIRYITETPEVCLIETGSTPSKNAVIPIGYEALLKRGLDDIYLFKKNGNSSELKCYFSVSEPGYVFTKNASSSSTTLSSSPGDFLFTKKGKLIGVFISYSKCYIIPTELQPTQFSSIPVTKTADATYFSEFSSAISELQKK